jgi:NADH:ubiquinone oxidoreductase subunit 2 (subunit N)
VVVVMFMQPLTRPEQPAVVPGAADIAVSLAVAGTIGLGIVPTGLFNLASQSVDALRQVFGLG